MPSHLTRSVFRRLLANQPILHRGCIRQRHDVSLRSSSRALRPPRNQNVGAPIYQQRRHFLNFNIFSSKREAKEADMDPGLEKMMELEKRQRMRARMPEVGEMLLAVTAFAREKRSKKQSMTDDQARLVDQTLRYCFDYINKERDDSSEPLLDKYYLAVRMVANSLSSTERESVSDQHVQLAQHLYESGLVSGSIRSSTRASTVYVRTLSLAGFANAARDLILHIESTQTNTDYPDEAGLELDQEEEEHTVSISPAEHANARRSSLRIMWGLVLKSFVHEEMATEVEQTVEMIKQRGFDTDIGIAWTMVDFSMQRNDANALKHWWSTYGECLTRFHTDNDRVRQLRLKRTGEKLSDILKWCLMENHIQLGHDFVRDVMTENPPKPIWDAIFIWVAGTKKSVDEIGRTMTVMENFNEGISDPQEWRLPDIVTINGLVEFAISQNDPYMAERVIALGRERNIEPDALTHVLQMDYRLSVSDVDGALIAYKALVEHKNAKVVDESFIADIAAINRLIAALCGTKRHDFDTIMNVTMDLADRRAPFEAEAVSALAILHLTRNEPDDALDLLKTHAFHYSSTDRSHIRDAILSLALDLKTPTARAWRCYNIIRDVFDETSREQRTEMMTSFFTRERADMGVHVFQHMRMHSRDDTIPTVDTYVAALMGLARTRDIDSIEIIHNQLKLDFNITVTTYLRNALIIAYTAGDKGRKALGFWEDIVASKEGPSYNSIHVALRACEKSPFGDLRAKELWSLLNKRKVELDQALWASYVAALAGNGDNDTAINAVEEAEANGQLEVDAFLLGSLFDGATSEIKQEEIEAWAKERYHVQWKELESLGYETDVADMRTFNIDRRVAP